MSVSLTFGEYEVLSHYVADARSLSAEDFRQRHGDAFLVHEASASGFKPVPRTKATVAIDTIAENSVGNVPHLKLNFAVFPVRRTGRSPFPNFISIGRAKSNDVIIEDESVSKFHAFFRLTDKGDFVLQDGGSKNGTLVDEDIVPDKNKGAPVVVESGMRVRFGNVEMTFMTVPEFSDLVRRSM
ncbi:MAG: FHA domain-containing protein [Clostridia bacterium]|nr:FHA domain-containing protein [Deltaproteobacteria bacterium]